MPTAASAGPRLAVGVLEPDDHGRGHRLQGDLGRSRLGIGTAGQALVVNSGATASQWGTASGGTVTSVSWTGDGTIFTATADTAVTTSGTLTPASLIAQTKSTVLAGPTSGGSAGPHVPCPACE